MKRADVLVLGAGMVGVSTALHLQKRGASVLLIDRKGVGEETSHGNAGLIQREGVVPYHFPRDLRAMSRYALNLLPEANLHWSALPRIAPWLARYFLWSTPAQIEATSRAARPLVERCIIEHEALMQEAGIIDIAPLAGGIRISMLGIFPTLQSMGAQLLMLVAVGGGFVLNRRRAVTA